MRRPDPVFSRKEGQTEKDLPPVGGYYSCVGPRSFFFQEKKRAHNTRIAGKILPKGNNRQSSAKIANIR